MIKKIILAFRIIFVLLILFVLPPKIDEVYKYYQYMTFAQWADSPPATALYKLLCDAFVLDYLVNDSIWSDK